MILKISLMDFDPPYTRGDPGKMNMNDLVSFCNRITPVNWHVATSPDQFVFQGPGTLNIFIRVLDHFIDGWFYAFKKGVMEFHPVSLYSHLGTHAVKSFKRYGDHLVAESEIWLYPQGCRFFGDDPCAAAVHELAHVAVDRWLALKGKSNMETKEIPQHGDVFCRAFETLMERVHQFGGQDKRHLLESMEMELQNYRSPHRRA